MNDYIKGRGSQIQTTNPYKKLYVENDGTDDFDEPLYTGFKTEIIYDYPKTILNKVKSPDVGMAWSMNPYQGCEHGCTYCYARNSHEYWGLSAGIDFESKIIVKQNAPQLLRKALDNPKWTPDVISLSGNTDCYQPVEKELKITRQLLEVLAEYKNPVGIITKNKLVIRDLDILKELAKNKLVHVVLSITSLNEELRQKLEPRTATYKSRLETIETLASHGIPVGVMVAPIIPGLNNYDMVQVMKAASEAGANWAGYTIVRLNGSIEVLFKDWLQKNHPNAFDKVWSQIQECHGGSVNDSEFGRRMRGEGKIAESIRQLFYLTRQKYFPQNNHFEFNLNAFKRPQKGQLRLFE